VIERSAGVVGVMLYAEVSLVLPIVSSDGMEVNVM
jgi:hypothetical protein